MSERISRQVLKKSFVSFLVNILELQKQPKEITRELKSAREELDIAKNVEEPIQGDKFSESVEVEFTVEE